MKNKRNPTFFMLLLMLLLVGPSLTVCGAEKQTIYNSPYITFSPDGQAFTTNAGDKDHVWYEAGERVTTGITSTIRGLETGEHYYKISRSGEIPVGYWQVEHMKPNCIHDTNPGGDDWHGINYGTSRCMRYYFSGWIPYCADCGDVVVFMLFYMNRQAAEAMDYLPAGMGMSYYYLCPHCTNMEQGCGIGEHRCNGISWNRYKVQYKVNLGGTEKYGGHMEDSLHIYNNASVYEGQTVTPVTHLNKNNYTRTGYEFAGWNTEPDGSGTAYEDGAEIWNLTTENWSEQQGTGIVLLYAQWRPSKSTLQIDPAGGSYLGSSEITKLTREYLTVYTLAREEIAAPLGYQVSFQTNGGAEVPSVTGARRFVEWARQYPFWGNLSGDQYTFLAPDGYADSITAVYEPIPIILPEAKRPGYSFGGWYYDSAFTKPAGGAGDGILPSADITLYAQWVDLKLTAVDNYSAGGGKGAVDLSWTQADGQNKSYLLYQSTDGTNWTKINGAEDIGSSFQVEQTWNYTGSSKSYTVPYAGLYTITADGARGGNYGNYRGGYGGRVLVKVWLSKGENLIYTIGGSNGYNKGGKGNTYASGGGCTVVSTDRKGTILIAGGGGGATVLAAGGAGGSSAGIVGNASLNGTSGQTGGAGGGGGYQGGSAGQVTYHAHSTGACGWHSHQGNTQSGGSCYRQKITRTWCGVYTELVATASWRCGINGCDGTITLQRYDGRGPCGAHGNEVYQIADCNRCSYREVLRNTISASHWYDVISYTFNCSLKEGYQCGKSTSTVVSSRPAYGGSSYVNSAVCNSYSTAAGVQAGNGVLTIRSEGVGFQEVLSLTGVTAVDMASPEEIEATSVKREGDTGGLVKLIWDEPADRGTEYYHVAESFQKGSLIPQSRSNVTSNTLTSGIRGYHYVLDHNNSTVVNVSNSTFQTENTVTISLKQQMQYLHVAAVDVAGNLGTTTHIEVGSLDQTAVLWPLYTRQMTVTEGENVFRAAQEKTYYVRSDGETPFTLQFATYIEGAARREYQPNYTIFETSLEGQIAQSRIHTPSHEIQSGIIETRAEDLSYGGEGEAILQRYPYAITIRDKKCSQLSVTQSFLLGEAFEGKQISIIPRAGADSAEEIIYSSQTADWYNGIIIIGDNEAPQINGLEVLEETALIDRRKGDLTLNAIASDALSGIREFTITIRNEDSREEKSWHAGEDGSIGIHITEDESIFSGDFTVTAYAVDNVGNEQTKKYRVTEFSLETEVSRILEPHDPIFQCGESGILHITTWGYADRVEVEFPEELLVLNPDLNKIYLYETAPGYKKEEQLQFMIPLYTPANQQYTITVRAYKGDRKLEKHPSLSTVEVSGSVLDELRTRLR